MELKKIEEGASPKQKIYSITCMITAIANKETRHETAARRMRELHRQTELGQVHVQDAFIRLEFQHAMTILEKYRAARESRL